jgi:hypothetical protein
LLPSRRRKHVCAPAAPDTLIGLLSEASKHWDQVFRLLVLTFGLIGALFAGIGVAGAIVVLALKGTGHINPRYLAGGIFGGSSLVTLITILVRKAVKSSQGGTGNGKPPP